MIERTYPRYLGRWPAASRRIALWPHNDPLLAAKTLLSASRYALQQQRGYRLRFVVLFEREFEAI
jgi:hypothetical protein